MRNSLWARTLAFSIALFSSSLYAQLAVDRIIVDFNSDSAQKEDVQLSNTSDTEPLYVKVEVLEVDKPGTPEETRVVADDPFKIGLLASPAKLIIPPGGRKLVRLVPLQVDENQERIYRVNFTPVAGKFEPEDNGEEQQTSVRLLIGYQALVIVRPTRPVFDLVGKRDGNTLHLANKGNSNIYLSQVRQCETEKLEKCTALTDNRLYPGNEWDLELKSGGPVLFSARDGESYKPMVFK